MAIKTMFDKTQLVDTWGLPFEDETADGVEVISDKIVGHRRWSVDHELIFRAPEQPPGQAWRVMYSTGATESQDESPWEYEDTIEATLVHEVEKTIKVWEPAP